MRAYGFREYGGPEVQEHLDLEVPAPMAGELLVEVAAAGVNPVDWKIRAGYMKDFLPLEMPVVLGQEAAGVVRAVGQDVEGFAVGDEVFGNTAPNSGCFAEYALTTAAVTAHKPPHVSFVDAATLTVSAATAYDGVTQLALRSGQTLLVNGASGGVGIAAAQIARDAGITVVGTASPANREIVESVGAIFVPYGDGVAERIRQLLPDGVEAILDLGGGDGLRAVAELLQDRSRLVSAGDSGTAGELGGGPVDRARNRSVLDAVAAMVANGTLSPLVQDVLPLAEAGAAMAAVEVGHSRGKVVVTP